MTSISVIGLGYVGLPTASMLATRGFAVHGYDIDASLINRLAGGNAHYREADLDTLVRAAIQSGALHCATQLASADVYIIAVPTPLGAGRRADLRAVDAAAHSVASVLKSGDLVILESTVPPGTTTGPLRHTLESGGLRAGRDFMLAHCPERVLPGRLLVELVTNDRVIGGIDGSSADGAASIYKSFVTGDLVLTDATTAELVKLMENTYRDVNIALANEFALIAEHLRVDVHEAIRLAGRHPRVRFLKPGPGVGGHCIAIDPWFVVESAPELARLVALSRAINDGMPAHVVSLVRSALGSLENKVVIACGLTYKADVDDTRESPSAEVISLLQAAGAKVRQHDPIVRPEPALSDLAHGADALVLLVDHAGYRDIDPVVLASRMRTRIAIDTRAALDGEKWRAAGFALRVLGVGATDISSATAPARK